MPHIENMNVIATFMPTLFICVHGASAGERSGGFKVLP